MIDWPTVAIRLALYLVLAVLFGLSRTSAGTPCATETQCSFDDPRSGCVSIESVTISWRIGLRSSFAIEPSANTPCETAA